jgi:hypothetical protein
VGHKISMLPAGYSNQQAVQISLHVYLLDYACLSDFSFQALPIIFFSMASKLSLKSNNLTCLWFLPLLLFEWLLRFSVFHHSSYALFHWQGTCKSLINAQVFLSQPLLGSLSRSNCSNIRYSHNSQTPNTSIGFSISVCVVCPSPLSSNACLPVRSHSTNVHEGTSGPKCLTDNRTSISLFVHKFKKRLLIKLMIFPFLVGGVPPSHKTNGVKTQKSSILNCRPLNQTRTGSQIWIIKNSFESRWSS